MNIKTMRTRLCSGFKVDDAGPPAQARECLLAIRRFGELCAEGCVGAFVPDCEI